MFDILVYRDHFTHLAPAHIGGTLPQDTDTLLAFVDSVQHTGCRSILEIGMNQGGSALAFLCQGCMVTSIDTIQKSISIDYLTTMFRDQFHFLCMDSKDIISDERTSMWHGQFDLAFIDGDHGSPGVDLDATHCIQLGIPYLLFDDTLHAGHSNIRALITSGVQSGRWDIIREYTANCGKTLVKVR